jgi:hypothetical protein
VTNALDELVFTREKKLKLMEARKKVGKHFCSIYKSNLTTPQTEKHKQIYHVDGYLQCDVRQARKIKRWSKFILMLLYLLKMMKFIGYFRQMRAWNIFHLIFEFKDLSSFLVQRFSHAERFALLSENSSSSSISIM